MAFGPDVYWDWPLEGETRSRRCKACEERVMFNAPDAVWDPQTSIGHDPDCPALSVWLNGLAADPPIFQPSPSVPGGGGEPSPVTLARADITLARTDITLATTAA